MCYSEWSRKYAAELEALEQARKEAEELTRRAMKPKPVGGAAAPKTPEKQPAEKLEPVAG